MRRPALPAPPRGEGLSLDQVEQLMAERFGRHEA